MQEHHKITYRTTINAPVEKVWNALTNPEMVKKYFFGSDLRTDWKVGSTINFTGEYEGKSYNDKGIVQEYEPNRKLVFSYLSDWSGKEDRPENYLLVGYEVRGVDGGTELTITQTNYDAEKAKHSEENWAAVVGEMKKLVE